MAYKYDPNAGGGEEQKEYERPTVGPKAARCLMAIEMGTVQNTHPQASNPTKVDVMIVFELAQKMADGQPFVVNWKGTFSFGDNSHMMRHFVPWRGGQPYTEQEKIDFNLGNLVGVPALVQITENPDKQDPKKIWTNIQQIGQLPEEMNMPDLVNTPVHFEIENIGGEAWDNLYPWVQKMIIEKSEEGKAYLAANPGFEYGKKTSQADQPAPEAKEPGTDGAESKPSPKAPF